MSRLSPAGTSSHTASHAAPSRSGASTSLEFDTVVVLAPERLPAADRYVALTRATQRLGAVRVRG